MPGTTRIDDAVAAADDRQSYNGVSSVRRPAGYCSHGCH